MKRIAPETIEEARQMDLLTYLKNYEPYELVRCGRGTYCTRTHDSLKLSNGLWMWWSQGIGGRSALDYLVKVKGIPFVRAIETIMNGDVNIPANLCTKSAPKRLKFPILPQKNKCVKVITKYLSGRGIDEEIINDCIEKGLIYESTPHHNVIFIGKDEEGRVRYAGYRATNKTRVMGDACGSDKRYSFNMEGTNKSDVHLFESSIDALSYATLLKIKGADWRAENLVSTAGVYMPKQKNEDSKVPAAFVGFLERHTEIRRVHIHFDSDCAGIRAAKAIATKLSDRYEVVYSPPGCGKDYNDFLCMELGKYRTKGRSVER